MEDKGREDAAGGKTNAEPAQPEVVVEGSRRRAGGLKRKASAASGGGTNSSTPSKRLAKEKPLVSLSQHHNGPWTRARQSPNKFAAAAASTQQKPADSGAFPVVQATGDSVAAAGDSDVSEEEQKPAIDSEFEAVKSREANAHVVPTPAGWFSWTKIHPLEERVMASFFNGKSQERTSNIYKQIRNAIMEKFHADPQTNIEVKHLSEISVGNADVKQEVLEFLDQWGLINFHPFPPESAIGTTEVDVSHKVSSLINKLYDFDLVQSSPSVAKTAISEPTALPRMLPDSAIFEDLVRPEGPGVEYHCNTCSADCSRKRYHCQTQADFDLCMECYNDGKFGSGMTSADFILMESAEGPGVSGGSWTDQETLLLLEALELYGENWNEIAEHVATKTKTQCILHFVQMPIEDPFQEGKDDIDLVAPGIANVDTSKKDPRTSDTAEGAKDALNATNEEQSVLSSGDNLKPKDEIKVKNSTEECRSSAALDALKAAFEVVGSLPCTGGILSFVEAANPVMALAAYLAGLLGNDVAIASARSSLKAMSEDSPSIQLAARHCFLLEDPPSGKIDSPAADKQDPPQSDKDPSFCESGSTADIIDGKAQTEEVTEAAAFVDKSDGNKIAAQESPMPAQESAVILQSIEKVSLDTEKETSDLDVQGEALSSTTKKKEPSESNLSGDVLDVQGEAVPSTTKKKEPSDSNLSGDVQSGSIKESADIAGSGQSRPDAAILKESGDLASAKEDTPSTGMKESSRECSEVAKGTDMVTDSVLIEEKEPQQTVCSTSTVGTGYKTAENDTKAVDDTNDKSGGTTERKDDHDIEQITRAAVTVLSAATVKAKLLANQEEDQIRELASLLVEKQLRKLETKLSLFAEVEMLIIRVREQLDRARQRLYHERAQIIASRLGLPASASRAMASSIPPNKVTVNYAGAGPRPPNMMAPKLPVKGVSIATQSKVI
ncbi:SWI/SNF complex subunit SWI3D-like [Aristolochia californica]|uniref:SWI/SNF complex subunit SWI3D-like n=1 Tax=Aristolochia californica TaxID=171875 RepID=UPI0035E30AF0